MTSRNSLTCRPFTHIHENITANIIVFNDSRNYYPSKNLRYTVCTNTPCGPQECGCLNKQKVTLNPPLWTGAPRFLLAKRSEGNGSFTYAIAEEHARYIISALFEGYKNERDTASEKYLQHGQKRGVL